MFDLFEAMLETNLVLTYQLFQTLLEAVSGKYSIKLERWILRCVFTCSCKTLFFVLFRVFRGRRAETNTSFKLPLGGETIRPDIWGRRGQTHSGPPPPDFICICMAQSTIAGLPACQLQRSEQSAYCLARRCLPWPRRAICCFLQVGVGQGRAGRSRRG